METLFAIILLVVVIYAPVLRGAFVADDLSTVLSNEKILSGDPTDWFRNIRGIPRGIHALLVRHWSPATVIDHAITPDPYSFHIANVAVHLLNSFAVIWIFSGLGMDPGAALLGGLIFAIHPLATAAVAYIAALSVLVSSCFALLGLGLIVNHHALLALPFLGAAVISREDALAVFPLAALLTWRSGWAGWWIFLAVPPLIVQWQWKRLMELTQKNGDAPMGDAGQSVSFSWNSNFVTVPVMVTSRVRSCTATEWCANIGPETMNRPTVMEKTTNTLFFIGIPPDRTCSN